MRGFLIFFSFIILAIMVSKSFAHTKGGLQKKACGIVHYDYLFPFVFVVLQW